MTRALTVSKTALPLFVWPEQTEIAAIERARMALARRVANLPRFSHRRVVLEARMRALTEQQLQLECAVRARLQ